MKFINREKELKALNKKWKEEKAQLFVLYGKRRVGKTELIKQFIKGKRGVYFLADKRTVKEQLREVGRIIGNYYNDSLLERRGFENWLEVFEYLKKNIKEKFVFAIDEYPYLIEVDKAIPSIFQKGWDEYLKNTKVFLILSGSSVSMMESQALIYKSPLYGRRTGQLWLKPLTFYQSWQFFPQKKFDEFLQIYAIVGGLPAYLLQFDSNKTLKENIENKIFEKTEFLHNEIEFILKEELREPKNYLSILKAISWGKTKFGEIVNETGLGRNIINKYLGVLNRLQLIEKEAPVTEKSLVKSRKGVYRISDNFTRFWFQYLFPYKSDLEIEKLDEVRRKLKESFNILVAIAYEKVTQEILLSLEDKQSSMLRNKILSFERIGRWWEKDKEIDVVGLNSKTKEIIFGEAKWSEKPVGINVFEDLRKKAVYVQWNRSKRREYYVLFSKSGFTRDMMHLARQKKIFLVHKDKLI